MKSVSKILLIIGSITIPYIANAEMTDEVQTEVYNIDCTASYTKDGVSNSVRPHGTISVKNGISASPELMVSVFGPTMNPVYQAHVEMNVRPKEGNNNWRLWFTVEGSSTILKEAREVMSLEVENKACLQHSLSASETLDFTCSLFKQANGAMDSLSY